MTTDIHAHAVPADLVEALQAEVPAAAPALRQSGDAWYLDYPGGRRSGPVPLGMIDTAARLADMDACGVEVQALSEPPTHFGYRLPPGENATAVALHNDAMVSMADEHPERFVVLAALPLQDTAAALAELDRVAARPQVAGVEIGTNVAGRNLDHPDLEPVWDALERAGLAVVLHPDAVAGAERMQDHYLHNFVGNPTDTTLAAGSLLFGGVLSRHPGLRVALLHGGGFLPYQLGRLSHGWSVRPEPRCHLDREPRELLSQLWFDTLTHDAASLRFLRERVGTGRLCLGSDYPFDMADPDPVGSVRRALDAADHDAVLDGAPTELLTRRPARSAGRRPGSEVSPSAGD